MALLTAFYMFRLMGLTFWGAFRGPKEIWDRIHESPAVMTVPLILLAIPSVLLGIALGLPFGDSTIHRWLEPVFHHATEMLALPHEPYALFGIDGGLILASVTVAVIGLVLAWRYFGVELGGLRLPARPELVREISARPGLSFLYRASLNKWWFDELYHLLFIVIGGRLAQAIWWFDREVVDGTVNGIGSSTISRRPWPPARADRSRPELRARDRPRADRHGRVVPAPRGERRMTSPFGILTVVTFLPLVGALVVAILPSRWTRPVALAFALATWVVSLMMLIGYLPNRAGSQFLFLEAYDWIPIFGIQYKLGVDGLSAALVVLTTTLTWICILASWVPIQTRIKEYMISFLVLEVGLIGVFLALDLFLFYIFWEIVLVPMYLIIGIWGGANRIYSTIKFVLYTLVGSLLMLVAILATAFAYQSATGSWTGAFDLVALRAHVQTVGFAPALQVGAFLAFFLAFAIKVPMFPFHTWLPDAHTDAPTAGSVILAGVLLKLGAYGFLRFALPLYPDAAHTFAPTIIVLSLIAIIYGAIVALVQPDLKRLVAYSSVSHMGFVTLGTFVFTEQGIQGAILQMINHGLITGGLFLLVGHHL